MKRRLTILATLAALALAAAAGGGEVRAASYDVALDIGDAAVANCGAALEVTLFGPGDALVACVKDTAGDVAAGGPVGASDGLVFVHDLNTGDDLAVTCAGTLAVEWGAQDVALVCGW